MNQGIYEELVTRMVMEKINQLDRSSYIVNKTRIDKEEASLIISRHLSKTIKSALDLIKGDQQIEMQIEISNKLIQFLKNELKENDFDKDLIESEAEILKAVFSRINEHFTDLDLHLKEITPYTRLSHSELFTGGSNSGLSLESELKKEILSSNRIDLLVSFIKFKGIIILERELSEFTRRGGQLRIITTTYMGASDYKAIELLSGLKNTQVKISYNTDNERLHAKAYLFFRNTGFHTGYIGSSNFSRSALTDGLEWNVKITTKEVAHLIDKFQKTFESYWRSDDFELFDKNIHRDKLVQSLNHGKKPHKGILNNESFFDIKPHVYQMEILEKLEVERTIHNRYRNLIVAATGTGKTVISAFDYKNFRKNNPTSKFLFLAHRKEILEQALSTFRGILRENNFGSLWYDGIVPDSFEYVFATIQTFNNKLSEVSLSPEFYDYIVFDECHHLPASSYRSVINYFKPVILLGLTATPERMDEEDITGDFHNKIAAEIRLPDALNRQLLCPFQYFGISDSVPLDNITWQRGKYSVGELSRAYTNNSRRVGEIIEALKKYTKDHHQVRALGFCITIEHARFMADMFIKAGFKADYLVSTSSNLHRDTIRRKLINKQINYLFVVDIFNEGIDIPEIDTVMFLRPTESLTVFLQQLGRGLRLADNKDCLTVLDFVGNARPEYKFENKFRALIGKTTTPVKQEIEDNFPHLPLGCSIVLEKVAKEVILRNITQATKFSSSQLIYYIKNYHNETSLPLTLWNFIQFYNIPLNYIYKKYCWMRLCHMAGILPSFDHVNETSVFSAIKNKWLSTSCVNYFEFILGLAQKNFEIQLELLTPDEKIMALMLHYDVWQSPGGFESLEESIQQIGKNPILVQEIIELLEILIDRIDYKTIDISLPYNLPLKLHARYTRDQILAAFCLNSFSKASSFRIGVGVAENKTINTEILFIDLIKSEEKFSPTTMYDDYAINDRLFHWQSQNSAGPDTPKGYSYIHHRNLNKKILLFVREKAKDEFGSTMGYVFVGEGLLQHHYGSKPMSIEWALTVPLPHYLWKDAVKLLAS